MVARNRATTYFLWMLLSWTCCGISTAPLALAQVGDCLAIVFVDPQHPDSQSMEQVAAQAIEMGWAIRRVDARQELHVTERWRIHTAPTTVLTQGGREVDRILGPVNWTELYRRMIRFSAPDSIRNSPLAPSEIKPKVDVDSLVPMQRSVAPLNPEPLQSDPARATVRIMVDEPNSHAIGSGTVIQCDAQGAVVLTCGHLFRDRTPKSVITVERFENGMPVRYVAELIDYQIEDVDIGLLLFHPNRSIPVAQVAQHVEQLAQGDPVYSMGCDHGEAPSRRDSQVTKLNRYLGSANIETAGAPVQGRSGGGLFNRQGELVGVCFAADTQLDEGLYCGIPVVHEQLKKLGLLKLPSSPVLNHEKQERSLTGQAPTTMTVILTDSSGSTSQLTIDRPSEQLIDKMRNESQRSLQANAQNQVRWKLTSAPNSIR
ncbi:MAG: trypsin-like peptidase domain-containing protein [Pirellula sp.]|nr:trypsin-like peptidase domain-containing protein [Pirellula sp.]